MHKQRIYKRGKLIPRSDLTLNQELATSLVQLIFSGEDLFCKHNMQNGITLPPREGEENEKPRKIRTGTVRTWVYRNVVIPGTDQRLRDILDDAREEYRRKDREKRHKKMLDDAEKKLHRAVRIDTKSPVVTKHGTLINPHTKEIMMKEDAHLLAAQITAAKFLAERLDPERYGRREKVTNTNFNFSLSDLRKYEEGKNTIQGDAEIIK